MTIEKTLNERGARYGDFSDHAAICDALINVCMGAGNASAEIATSFITLDPVKRQAIRVICDKLARILSPGGDPEYRDNWHDIQGYAKLAEDRCKDGDAVAQEELPLPYDGHPIMPEIRNENPAYCAAHGRWYSHEYPCPVCELAKATDAQIVRADDDRKITYFGQVAGATKTVQSARQIERPRPACVHGVQPPGNCPTCQD